MLNNKIEFTVVDTVDHSTFEETVQSLLNLGWVLHGSLIAFPNYSDAEGKVEAVRYIQALMKKTVLDQANLKVLDA